MSFPSDQEPLVNELENYFDDLVEDGKLSEDNKSRLVRTGRSLFQVATAAVVVTVGDSVMNVVQGQEPLNLASVGKAAAVAAVTAVVAYFHKRKA